jgi:glutathione S-transferase
MLRLHDYPGSQNGWKVRALARLLGIDLDIVAVDIFAPREAAFLKLNPMGAVPVLELDDGRALSESNAILCFLADGTSYLPAEPFLKASVLRWLFFEEDYAQSSIASLRYWRLTGRMAERAAEVPAREATAGRVLATLEAALTGRPFLVGPALTIADIALYAYTHLTEEGGLSLAPYPLVRRWIAAVAEAAAPLPPVLPYGPEAMVGS